MLDYKKILIVLGVMLSVGCQDITPQMQGTVIGGVLGGVIGKDIGNGSTTGVIAGTLVGSYIGEKVASSLQRYRPKITDTMEHSRSEVQTQWQDPDGARYVLVPQSAVREGGKICRTFRMTVETDEGREVVHGRACRYGKGQWDITEQPTKRYH